MQLTPGQIESILAGVLVNGQPLTLNEIRVIYRGLKAYQALPDTHPDERARTFILMDSLNQILIERG